MYFYHDKNTTLIMSKVIQTTFDSATKELIDFTTCKNPYNKKDNIITNLKLLSDSPLTYQELEEKFITIGGIYIKEYYRLCYVVCKENYISGVTVSFIELAVSKGDRETLDWCNRNETLIDCLFSRCNRSINLQCIQKLIDLFGSDLWVSNKNFISSMHYDMFEFLDFFLDVKGFELEDSHLKELLSYHSLDRNEKGIKLEGPLKENILKYTRYFLEQNLDPNKILG